MLRSILVWGLVVGAVMTILLYAPQILYFDRVEGGYKLAELVGYIGMIASLLIIAVAINAHFKDQGADVSIWARVKLGLGITFVAGLIFGLTNLIYSYWINPEFMDQYYAQLVAEVTAAGGDDVATKIAEMEQQREMFASPIMIFLVMAATVWMVGIVVSLITAIGHWYFARRNSVAATI